MRISSKVDIRIVCYYISWIQKAINIQWISFSWSIVTVSQSMCNNKCITITCRKFYYEWSSIYISIFIFWKFNNSWSFLWRSICYIFSIVIWNTDCCINYSCIVFKVKSSHIQFLFAYLSPYSNIRFHKKLFWISFTILCWVWNWNFERCICWKIFW